MILMLDREMGLSLYASTAEAERDLEAIDIENNEYEFCDERGQKIAGQITEPITRFRSGRFRLVTTGEADTAVPLLMVSRARRLERKLGTIKNLDHLKAVLSEAP